MACESEKCEKYGLHHDFKDGVEIRKCFACEKDSQPERSKREDLKKCVICELEYASRKVNNEVCDYCSEDSTYADNL